MKKNGYFGIGIERGKTKYTDYCSFCKSDAPIFKLKGNVNCYYCGNELCFCKECFKELQEKVKKD